MDVASNKTLTWGIDLSAASATVTKSGAGTWKFNNTGGQVTSNTTTLDVTAGTLQFDTASSSANLFTGTGGVVTAESGSIVSLVQTSSSGYVSARTWSLGSKLILNGGTLNGGSSNGAQFQRLTATTAIQVDAASAIAQSSGNFAQNFTVEGTFTGTGALSLNRAANNTRYLNLKGDMSGYSGNVTIGTSTAAGYVLFGHSSGWGTGNLTLTGSGSRVMIGDEAATAYHANWTGGSALGYTAGTFSPAGAITVGAGAELGLMNSTPAYAILFSPASGITVNGGTLSSKGAAGASAFVPAATTTWTFGGSALSTVSGNVQFNNSGVTFQVADAVSAGVDTTVTGTVSGSNGFTKTGAGALSFTAGNGTWAGDIVIDNGIVQADAAATLGSGTITIGQANTSATSHSLRLNGATIANNIVSQYMYTTDYLGAITAQGGATSTINGSVTIRPNISGAPNRGGTLASTGTGSVLRLNGTLDVAGGQTTITQRDGTVEYAGGSSTSYTLGVTGTARLAANNGIGSGVAANLGVSGNANLDLNGYNLQLSGLTRTANTAIVTNAGAADSTLTLSSSTNWDFSGTIQDGATNKVSLVKDGASVFTLSGASTYTGDTAVSAGTLLVNGSLGNSAVSVAAGAAIGGTGSIGGPLGLDGGAFLNVVNTADALAVSGTVTFGTGFGVDNVTGLDWDALELWTPYTVIATTQDFSTAGLDNFGFANAGSVGSTGRLAFFQDGSLQIVITPEPSVLLLGGISLLGLLRRRR